MPSRILLIGMMGVGKTTVGAVVADRLGWGFLDSDAEIVRSTGLTVPEIFKIHGEPAFRAQEARVLAWAATSDRPVVVSVAGGALREPANRRWVTGAGFVVWLRASVETMAARVGTGAGRPMLGGDPAAALRRLYPERQVVYRQVADAVVDVDGIAAVTVAEQVLSAWRRRSS